MNDKKQPPLKVRYSETSSLFASQFLLNSTDEDITISYSSGYLSEPGSQETTLPIHTRISMSRQGAKRLHALLTKALQQEPSSVTKKSIVPASAKAKLPKM